MIFNAVQRSAYFPEANLLLPRILFPYLKNRYLCLFLPLATKTLNATTQHKLPRAPLGGEREREIRGFETERERLRHTGKAPWPVSKKPEATSPIDIQACRTLRAHTHVGSRQLTYNDMVRWQEKAEKQQSVGYARATCLRHTLYTEQRERRSEATPGEAIRS